MSLARLRGEPAHAGIGLAGAAIDPATGRGPVLHGLARRQAMGVSNASGPPHLGYHQSVAGVADGVVSRGYPRGVVPAPVLADLHQTGQAGGVLGEHMFRAGHTPAGAATADWPAGWAVGQQQCRGDQPETGLAPASEAKLMAAESRHAAQVHDLGVMSSQGDSGETC